MGKIQISFNLNGKDLSVEVSPDTLLVDLLRDHLGLTGTKAGCREGECGACTVILDGSPVNSCILPAVKVMGKSLITIEGLAGENGELDAIQKSFVNEFAVQCGFCTPGMIMNGKALLDREPNPDDKQIRDAISGVLCRCTGYAKIIEAIKKASENKAG